MIDNQTEEYFNHKVNYYKTLNSPDIKTSWASTFHLDIPIMKKILSFMEKYNLGDVIIEQSNGGGIGTITKLYNTEYNISEDITDYEKW